MEKNFRVAKIREHEELTFSWGNPEQPNLAMPKKLFYVELTVDANGNPTYAELNSFELLSMQKPGSSAFDTAVKTVMKTLLKNDANEFKRMKNSLNSKYKEIAKGVEMAGK